MLNDIIQVPYLTAPKMQRHQAQIFNKISETTKQYKQKELELFDKDLYGALDIDLIAKVSKILNVTRTTNIVELALQIEEDIAIMANGILSAICFCFPSSWVPAQRLGLTFKQIHEPIADNQRLLEASERIVHAMVNNGPFKRYVWTITNNPGLSNHPKTKIVESILTIDNLYFRYETQTTMPLPELNAAILFVNVQVEPLSKYWDSDTDKKLILESINSMTDNILEYKSLHNIKKVLNRGN